MRRTEAHILSHLPTMAESRMERPSLSSMGLSWSAWVTSVVEGSIMGRISVMMGSSDDMAQDIQRRRWDYCHSWRHGPVAVSMRVSSVS